MSATPTGMSATFVYLPRKEKRAAVKLAERQGVTLSDVIRRALTAELERVARADTEPPPAGTR